MDLKETATEKAREHIVSVGFALITLLLLAVWQAIPSEVWGTVSDLTPKRALWALLGLATIAIGLQAAFAIDSRRKRKSTSTEPPGHKYFKKFGIMWDEDSHPRCPACQTLMNLYSSVAEGNPHDTIQCPKCQNTYALKKDDGTRLRLGAAKEIVAQETTALKKNKF